MATYVVVGGRNADALTEKIQTEYADSYHLPPSTWFISAALTPKELSKALGIANGVSGATAVVIPVKQWSGWAPPSLWDWLRARQESADG